MPYFSSNGSGSTATAATTISMMMLLETCIKPELELSGHQYQGQYT
uniref:Uncharacterized protein n=1 Tax=Rhizophora mucronata TaxID=61149 RepID=A0A2P2NXJ5_RHIMU